MKVKFSNKWFIFSVMAFIAILFTYPIYQNFDQWGQFDWDQHLLYNAVPRKALLEFNEFPLWNPYYCGGNALLANPQSLFLNPLYVVVLLFGVVAGLKLNITLHLLVGLIGMFMLARHLKLSISGSYLASFVYMLSSWFALKMLAGHLTYFSAALIPLVVLFFLKSVVDKKYIILSGLVMAVIIFSGGVYPLLFTVVLIGVLALFYTVQRKDFTLTINAVLLFVLFVVFAAVKLVPLYSFAQDIELPEGNLQYYDVKFLPASLLWRQQNPFIIDAALHQAYQNEPEQFLEARDQGKIPWDWHEYGGYIGIVPLFLALLSFFRWKKLWPWMAGMVVMLIIVLGNSIPLSLWQLLKEFPFMSALHGHSRFIIPFVLTLAVLAGVGFDYGLQRIKRKDIKTWAGRAVLTVVVLDLLLVSLPIYQNIFVREPVAVDTDGEFFHIVSSDPTLGQYPMFLQNLGTLNCYERIRPVVSAIPVALDNGTRVNQFKGNAYFAQTEEEVEITEFTTNSITVQNAISSPLTLVFNFNYDKGWKSNVHIVELDGLLAVQAPPQGEIRLRYRPNAFIFGLMVSLASILAALVYFFKK